LADVREAMGARQLSPRTLGGRSEGARYGRSVAGVDGSDNHLPSKFGTAGDTGAGTVTGRGGEADGAEMGLAVALS